MVVRVHNPSKWAAIQPGNVLQIPNVVEPRVVRIEFNAPAPARVDLVQEDGSIVFLAAFSGMEVVEFTAEQPCQVAVTSDEDVFFFTNEGDSISFENPHAVSFVQYWERTPRNPELERMMWKMEANMMRRLQQQADEREQARVRAEQRENGDGTADGSSGGAGGTSSGGEQPPGEGSPPDGTGTGVSAGSESGG